MQQNNTIEPKPKKVPKKILSVAEWEERFKKHVDEGYYSRDWVSSGSSSTGLSRIIKNPYVVRGE